MKKIKPGTAIFVIVFLLIILAMLWIIAINGLISDVGNLYRDEVNKFSKNIGKKAILEKDTLEVVDYSIWNGTYTLSNGKYVSREFVRKEGIKIKQ